MVHGARASRCLTAAVALAVIAVTLLTAGIGARAASPAVTGVALSPDGKLLAGAYSDGSVHVWELATGQAPGPVLRNGASPKNGTNGVAFSPDSKLLAAARNLNLLTCRLPSPICTPRDRSTTMCPIPGPTLTCSTVTPWAVTFPADTLKSCLLMAGWV
jgi:WD40 repeat protein